MTKTGSLFLLIFNLLFAISAYSQIVVQAQVSQDKVGLHQPFQLDVIISTSSQGSIGRPLPPNLEGFQVQGPSQRTNISSRMQAGANGMEYVTQKTVEYGYILIPQKLGKLSIGSFEVELDGKTYKTSPIDIEVLKTAPKAANSQRNQPNQRPKNPSMNEEDEDPFSQMDRMEEEMFNQLLKRRGVPNPFNNKNNNGANTEDEQQFNNNYQSSDKEPAFRSMPKNQDEAFFIQVEVDKTEVYEGEQIVVSWYLMTRGQLESLDRTKFPDLKGFWKEIIEEVPAIQFYQEVLNGVPYKKALLARHALFPLKSGETFIDEFKIKSKVRLPMQGWGMNPKAYEYTKSSQRVKIKVKPLPTEGRPADFTGAIGKFQIKANIEGTEPVAHQPLKLRIRYEGFGNAKGLELPSINWPEGLELFEVKNEAKYLKNGQSFKEFDVILIPRKEGALVIPAIQSSFFNPDTGKYYTEKSQEIPLMVKPGAPGVVDDKVRMKVGGDSAKKEKVLVISEAIPELKGYDRTESQLGAIWMGVFSSILLFFVGYSFVSFGWLVRKKDFKKELQKRIHLLEGNWSKRKSKDNYTEVTNLFYYVLGVISGEGGGSHELAKLLDKAPSSLRRQYEKEILELFEYFQTLSFAPDHLIADMEKNTNVKNHFDRVKKVLLACVEAKADNK